MQTADCGCMKTTYDQSSITSYIYCWCTKFDQDFEPYNEKFHYLFDFRWKGNCPTQARLKFHPGVNSGRMLIYERHSLL